MKAFIKKNKFFVSLLLIALIVISSLGVYIISKNNNSDYEEEINQEEALVDPNKQAEISAMSVNYTRSSAGISGNVITVTWAYQENASKINKVYLYLNDGTPINVTSNSYYDFTQGVYDYPTGNNKVKLELRLENGKSVEMEKTVYVKPIISSKQEVSGEKTTLKVTLEYVYDKANPVEVPDILIISNDSEIQPIVTYLDTQNTVSANKITARTTYSFAWNDLASMAKKLNVRWKFNAIQDSLDFTAINPLTEAKE